MRRTVLGAAENLFPGYFAAVMATGIVSIASNELGLSIFAKALLVINWAGYAILLLLTLLRLTAFPRQLIADLSSHQRGAGFFTLAAGTCLLGTQTLIIAGVRSAPAVLWYGGLFFWAIVMFSFFPAIAVRKQKPPLAAGISGAWLIAAVATQSLVVLRGALNADDPPAAPIQFLCLALFFAGCFVYLSIIPLIFYRLAFLRLSARDFSPPYWINMGALAITALAGATLILRIGIWPLLGDFASFLKGLTLFFWAAASWWIPFLWTLALWRYWLHRDRLAYDPRIWGMVFPLGMYAVGTFELSRALRLPFLAVIPPIFAIIAIAAWAASAAGLLVHLWLVLRGTPRA